MTGFLNATCIGDKVLIEGIVTAIDDAGSFVTLEPTKASSLVQPKITLGSYVTLTDAQRKYCAQMDMTNTHAIESVYRFCTVGDRNYWQLQAADGSKFFGHLARRYRLATAEETAAFEAAEVAAKAQAEEKKKMAEEQAKVEAGRQTLAALSLQDIVQVLQERLKKN
jgi:hypothetical protein